jgi:hypothetical protein
MRITLEEETEKILLDIGKGLTSDISHNQWQHITENYNLSEEFIEKYYCFLSKFELCRYQNLSEAFMEKHYKDLFICSTLSKCQNLSEAFMEKHFEDLNLFFLVLYQNLSPEFIKKHYVELAGCCVFDECNSIMEYQLPPRSYEDKLEEVKKYACYYKLKFDGEYLYCYRNHFCGNGMYRKNSSYEPGETYRDWHCDINPEHTCSYGFGIWPEGNTPIRVKVENWGTIVSDDAYGKGRVWEFEILSE